MPERRTRREALTAGLAGAATLALAPAARAARADEGEALTAMILAEHDAVFVYRDAALPDGLATLLAEHDLAHAQALATHLEALTMRIPAPTRNRDDLPPEALAVLDAPGAEARLRAVIAFERSLVDGCAGRLAVLQHANTVRTVATVMAGHAQHLAHVERISRR